MICAGIAQIIREQKVGNRGRNKNIKDFLLIPFPSVMERIFDSFFFVKMSGDQKGECDSEQKGCTHLENMQIADVGVDGSNTE